MRALPVITSCREADCFYNHDLGCHAPAINVGATEPKCDTFTTSGEHIARRPNGFVGACHVASCKHNVELTCHAKAIDVARNGDQPECVTYQARG